MITNKDFVHFHVHSEYSQLDGLSKIKDLVMEARKMGFPAIALTDHGNVMGYIKFLKECRAKYHKDKEIPYPTITPILGCEFYIARQMDIGQKQQILSKDGQKIPLKDFQPDGKKGNRHLNIYAMDWDGYQNLCTLSQRSYLDGFYFDPRIDIDLLSKYSKGLMGGSACLSSLINANLLYGRYKEAKKTAGILKEIFNNNFFLEVMYHGIPEEKAILPDILKLSTELDIPIVATNDCHYVYQNHSMSQELLMCMSSSGCIKNPNRMKQIYSEFYLKSAEEMYKIFKHIPHSLTNSFAMYERFKSDDIEKQLFGGMKLPQFEIPVEFNNVLDYLKHLAYDGLKKNGWENSQRHINALEMELEDVRVAKENNNYDFAKYFLIVKDYIDEARKRDILVGPGRGSGYASVLLRCLGITYGADPLDFGLIWERFLAFDSKPFIKESDFGFEEDVNLFTLDVDDLEEERELDDDLGGVDRY